MPFLYSDFVAGPLASFGAPVWNPFLNFLATPFRKRIRPVPVVFLRFAFSPQLSVLMCQPISLSRKDVDMAQIGRRVHFLIFAAGYPHDEQVCFWM